MTGCGCATTLPFPSLPSGILLDRPPLTASHARSGSQTRRLERRGRDALERETIYAYRVCSRCRAWVIASWRLVHRLCYLALSILIACLCYHCLRPVALVERLLGAVNTSSDLRTMYELGRMKTANVSSTTSRICPRDDGFLLFDAVNL